MLVTLTLSELHEIRRIENSVEEKVGKEKIAEIDISLPPLLVVFKTFVKNSFPLRKRRTF